MNGIVLSLLNGRLGNILFELSAGMSYARRTGKEFFCTIKDKPLTPYDDYRDFFSNIEVSETEKFVDMRFSVIKENQRKAPSEFPYIDGNVLLDGYFQSERYIDSDYIREAFRINGEDRKRIIGKYIGIEESVGIHVRRGDYLKFRNIFNIPDNEYYNGIYNEYFSGVKCFIASDDIPWCKENIHIDGADYIDDNPVETLRALSICHHHILSNSSFSWWGAWLEERSDSINIVKRNWFNTESGLCNEGIVPERWKEI